MNRMLRNYFKIALRNLIKQRSRTLVSLVSLVSLVVGLTAFILLMLCVRYELSYDAFLDQGDRVFRLCQYVPEWKFGGSNVFGTTSGIVAPTLKTEFPEVELAVRTKEVESPLTIPQKSILGRGLYADRDFLTIFPFPLIAGDRATALAEPDCVVLSRTFSERLFGREDPLGQVVTGERGRQLRVTGVMEDMPGNTHLRSEYLVSFLTMYSFRTDIDTHWGILNYNSYIRLRKGVAPADFEKKLPAIVSKYHEPIAQGRRYLLTALRDVHFAPHIKVPGRQSVDRRNITLLAWIAALILIIACVNHINLATAGAVARAKEVGIRKTIGATRRQLTRQFLGESFFLTSVAVGTSVAFAIVLLPAFGRIAGTEIPYRALADWRNVAGLLGVFLAVGFLAGGYPALYLSALKPRNVLKGAAGTPAGGGPFNFRNVLMVFQFGVTIVLVVAAVVVQKQLLFIKSRDIGYQRQNVVTVRVWDDAIRRNSEAIKTELSRNPLISSAALANTVPLSMTEANNIRVETDSGELADVPMVTTYFIDETYLDVLGMKLASGRNFSRSHSANLDLQVIINETTARMAGLKDPVGKKIVKWGQDLRIIGVVKDFHYTSLKNRIEPLMFSYQPQLSRYFLIKTSGRDTGAALAAIETAFRRFSPNFAFDSAFLDDLYNRLYANEGNLGRIMVSFSILALIIAAVGLYGLMSFVVARRTKEIGVRKILGASVPSVTGLVLRSFLGLIGAATLVAVPVAFHFTRLWLNGFVYRTGLDAGPFVLSILIVVGVALLSVGRQVVKAALANPVDSLRSE